LTEVVVSDVTHCTAISFGGCLGISQLLLFDC